MIYDIKDAIGYLAIRLAWVEQLKLQLGFFLCFA